VLEAAGNSITILRATGDFNDAERFASVCYDSLTRPPLDPDSYEAADAAKNLAGTSYDLIMANGPGSINLEEIEILARKAVRIIKKLKGPASDKFTWSFNVLSDIIIFLKKDYGEETKCLLEGYLTDAIKFQGLD
jgi:hypothetical protein